MSVPLIATVVDTDALLQTIAASFVAGVGVTFAFALAILGAVRFVDLRAEERPLAAGAFAALAIVTLVICAAAIVYGIVVTASE
jgi:hypothetical protein